MPEEPRALTKESVEIQAGMLRLDLSAVDAVALLDRVGSGLEGIDRADELSPGNYEPAISFSSGQDSQ